MAGGGGESAGRGQSSSSTTTLTRRGQNSCHGSVHSDGRTSLGAPSWHILPTGVMSMPTRNVVLGQQQHELVDQLVASGRYQNASEVLREGLRLLERRDAEDAARLAALRAAADQGWADVAAGRYVDVDEAGLDDLIADIGALAVADGQTPG